MNRTETTREKSNMRASSTATATVLAFAVIAGAWGCTSGTSTGVKTDASPQASTAPSETPLNRTDGSRDAPAVLIDAGEFAENIYDAAKAGDWNTVTSKLDALKANATEMSAEKLGSPEFGFWLARLQSAVETRDRTKVLMLANHLTLSVAELSAKFKPKMPVEVVKLDYYGRELEIWSAASDEIKLHETATLIRQTWDALKPKVEAKGAKKELAVFEALVAKTDAATTPADFARLATPILDQVDNLEKVFS